MRSILSCPSEPVGPTPKFLTWHDGAGTFWTYRAFSYGVNWGDCTPWWPFYAGVFETAGGWTGGYWPPSPAGARISDLPGALVVMADGPGTAPYLHGPYPPMDPFPTYHRPEPRHINQFNAAFVDGHARTGPLETLWTIEYWLRDYP
jgi:prepilin-type processing-associated H-X9-DG protein